MKPFLPGQASVYHQQVFRRIILLEEGGDGGRQGGREEGREPGREGGRGEGGTEGGRDRGREGQREGWERKRGRGRERGREEKRVDTQKYELYTTRPLTSDLSWSTLLVTSYPTW